MMPSRFSVFRIAASLVCAALSANVDAATDRCVQGYVWREAFPGDRVCVTPQTRSRTADENRAAASRRQPGGGAYGPDTCRQGYVWREAGPGDTVCVPPWVRDQAANDNRQAAQRREVARSASDTQRWCARYAYSAETEVREARRMQCSFSGPRWNPDRNAHYGWCLGATTAEAQSEMQGRRRQLDRCRERRGVPIDQGSALNPVDE